MGSEFAGREDLPGKIQMDWSRLSEVAKSVGLNPEAMICAFLEGVFLSSYHFDKYKEEKKSSGLKTLHLITGDRRVSEWVKEIRLTCEGTHWARDLGNEPANN